MSRFGLWVRAAIRDLRGDMRRFGILLACLALGTGTIAAVGSVGTALQAAIVRDANILMGGDFEASRPDREANPEELAFIESLGRTVAVVDTNARAETDEDSAFLDIVAVGDAYPLLGAIKSPDLPAGTRPTEALALRDGAWGALVDIVLLDRLRLDVGDRFRIGGVDYQIRGVLTALPDGAVRGFHLGLTTLVSTAALAADPEAREPLPGLLTHYRYKVVLGEMTYDEAVAAFRARFNDPEWVLQSPYEAAGNLARFYDLFVRFLLIVGLSSLLVGGVGVFNAVSAYLNERQRSIATMRSLGATSSRIMVHFLVQIGVLSGVGILIGLTIGAVTTALALPTLGQMLAVNLPPSVDVLSLLRAAGFGILAAFAFSYLPLVRAQRLKPALLFRAVGETARQLPVRELFEPVVALPLLLASAGIFLLAWGTVRDLTLVTWYAGAAIVTFALLRGAGALLQALLRRAPRLPVTSLRDAFRSIYGPGSPAPVVILSLGLGLAVLLVIVILDDNLHSQLLGEVTREAPTFVVTDLFEDELDEMRTFLDVDGRVTEVLASPMQRAQITSLRGIPSSEFRNVEEEAAFLLDGEIPISWAAEMPADTRIVEGEWWPADYDGPPLVSLRDRMKEALGLSIGDEIELEIFGEPLTATIANFRDYQFQNGLNFLVTLSPGEIEEYPSTWLATIKTEEGEEKAVERALAREFPQMTLIPVGDALNQAASILSQLSTAVNIVGGLAVLNGLLVLAGTMAAGRKQREADAVVRKVLGATRGKVVEVFVLEYSMLGAFAAIIATGVGILGAWAITQRVLEVGFGVSPLLVVLVLAGAVVLTVATGAVTTWRALSTKPGQYLRSAG